MTSDKNANSKILDALQQIASFLTNNNVPFCLIGGLAVQVRGEPRFTRDVDLCLRISLTEQERVCNLILKSFKPLVDDAKELAMVSHILPLEINGIVVDLAFGLSGFEKTVVARAVFEELTPNFKVKVCTAEDLVIYKCLAGRPKDVQDIDSILSRNKDKLDVKYIKSKLQELEAALSISDLLTLFNSRVKR